MSLSAPPAPTGQPLAVTHLLWGLETGGGQAAVLAVVRNGARLGVRNRVIAFHGGAAASLLEEAGCPVTVLGKRRGIDRALTARLADALARERPDLLHFHDFTACFWGNRAADRVGLRPRVATLHSWMLGLCWPKRLLFTRELRRLDRVIVLSQATRERLRRRGFADGAIAELPVGPDLGSAAAPGLRETTRAALGIPPGTVAALTCARLEPEKNLALLVELARRVGDNRPPLAFLVAGEGSCRSRLEQLVRKHGLASAVTLLGLRRDVPALLAAADIFLLPSLSEELPIALLEALAAGVPVVATPVGALPQIVPGEPGAGFLVRARDVDGWVRRVRDLAADPALRRSLGEEGRRRVRLRYDVSANVAALAACYRELVGRRT